MMRTTDGKLAVVDFGLMTEVTANEKYGMIKAIAHLIHRDYDQVGQDFIHLDFIPEETDTPPSYLHSQLSLVWFLLVVEPNRLTSKN